MRESTVKYEHIMNNMEAHNERRSQQILDIYIYIYH